LHGFKLLFAYEFAMHEIIMLMDITV